MSKYYCFCLGQQWVEVCQGKIDWILQVDLFKNYVSSYLWSFYSFDHESNLYLTCFWLWPFTSESILSTINMKFLATLLALFYFKSISAAILPKNSDIVNNQNDRDQQISVDDKSMEFFEENDDMFLKESIDDKNIKDKVNRMSRTFLCRKCDKNRKNCQTGLCYIFG